jgi:hypothetical protein
LGSADAGRDAARDTALDAARLPPAARASGITPDGGGGGGGGGGSGVPLCSGTSCVKKAKF